MIDFREELENRGIDFHESGDGYIMLRCPMPDHDDNNPSFSINLATGSYRCFGCEARGTFVQLIAELDGISEGEAARNIKSSTSIDNIISRIEESFEDRSKDVRFMNEKSFHKVFPKVFGTPGYEYLQGRGITKESVIRFDARWGDHGKYRDRVVLPIKMPKGQILSYVGRTIHKGVVPKTRKARSAARTLYGIHEILRDYLNYSGHLEYIVLVEGEFDAMYLQQFGVPAVAVMGTSVLNKYQLRILRKMRSTVVLSYDADEAGRKAMYGDGKNRAGELRTLKRYFPTITVRLPEGKDPNDLAEDEVRRIYGKYTH